MIKNKQTRRIIVLTIILLSMMFTHNNSYAQSTGPNAPEAAAFEPVDATDMVNLLTGNFTYVLPLLNVPSPEGGYPIALSYHAGIGMDQEASWVGLGWNLNPGAINRTVNGLPDDTFYSRNIEFFYSKTEKISEYQASLGYSGHGFSVATGVSWGSNRSLGGFVSVGVGIDLGSYKLGVNGSAGTNGVGIGAGLSTPSGLSFGISAHSKGGVSGSLGFNKNGAGFNISSTGAFGVSVDSKSVNSSNGTANVSSIGISFSSGGIGISVTSTDYEKREGEDGKKSYHKTGSTGVGMNSITTFNNTLSMGDYSTSTRSSVIPITIPTPIGVFSFSFGKTTFKYWLNKWEETRVTGPVHFNKIGGYIVNIKTDQQFCYPGSPCTYIYRTIGYLPKVYTQEELDNIVKGREYELKEYWLPSIMDINELPVEYNDISAQKNILSSSPNFPNYDKYNVQAQGLSGSITPTIYENGALFGFSEKTSSDNKKLSYIVNDENGVPANLSFKNKTSFIFENEITTYFETPKATFGAPTSSNFLTAYKGKVYNSGTLDDNKAEIKKRRRTSNYIEYFTNEEIFEEENKARTLSKGYLEPIATGFSRELVFFEDESSMPEGWYRRARVREGIGAFKITAIDGRTYHYSLPVYNEEIIQRSYGTMKYKDGRKGIKPESEAYFEKRQQQPYATHWLLTTITGPDFVDTNNNGIADKEDYGYWVNFEYGKYSNAYIWSTPYGKDLIIDEKDPNKKTWIKGRKEIYYLDKISTRTHTAYFVKSERKDATSVPFNYKSAECIYTDQIIDKTGFIYSDMFTIPKQKVLKLDKILLVKNEGNLKVDKSSGNVTPDDFKLKYPFFGGEVEVSSIDSVEVFSNMKNNVIDTGDDLSHLKDKTIKAVEFDNNHYELVRGTPHSEGGGRLTLKGVTFKGNKETSVLPPYRFNYITPYYNFNIEDKDEFGYYKDNNSIWSLNEITTPQGGKIKVEYENHVIKSAVKSKIVFGKNNNKYKIYGDYPNGYQKQPTGFIIESYKDVGIKTGSKLDINYRFTCLGVYDPSGDYGAIEEGGCSYEGLGTVTEKLGDNKYYVVIDQEGVSCINYLGGSTDSSLWNCDTIDTYISAEFTPEVGIEEGGIRVKRVSTVSEEGKYYNMNYSYGENGDGIGYVTYLPYAPELAKELPYSSELPPPIPMYEYVSTTTSTGNSSTENNIYGVKTDYQFNVLKSKEEGKAKFGDFYELTSTQTYGTSTSYTQLHDFVIKDNLGAIGQLISVKSYNEKGQVLSNIENTYYKPGETPNKIGVTQESYQTYKRITDTNNNEKKLGVTSTRIVYPNLLKHSTELKGGNSFTSEFNDLDPVTGQAREVFSYSSTGHKILRKSEQAYLIYPKMGSKVDEVSNKNMLSQVAASYDYLFKDGEWKAIGVGITTWKNIWDYTFNNNSTGSTNKVWRKHKTYTWKGPKNEDGTLDFTEADGSVDFNWGIGSTQTTNWQETSNVTRYNQFSQPLEVKDINGNYAATKMGDNYSKVIAIANAGYDEMYYSGAEYLASENSSYFDGGISSQGRTADKAHTGKYSVKATSGVHGYLLTMRNSKYRSGKYKVSVWVDKANYGNIRINDGSLKVFNGEKVFAGEWVLMTHYFDLTTGDKNIYITVSSGTSYIDDFRLHPVSSSMMSYVYNEWDEVSYITGANGLSTHYIYDAAGRLIETQVETVTNVAAGIEGGFEKVSENKYNYKRNNQ